MYPKHTNTPEDSCSLQAGQRLPYPCWVLPCHPSEHFPSGKQERRRISSTTTLLPNHFFRGRLQGVETMKFTPVTLAIPAVTEMNIPLSGRRMIVWDCVLTDASGLGVGSRPPPGRIPATAFAGARRDKAFASSGITPTQKTHQH